MLFPTSARFPCEISFDETLKTAWNPAGYLFHSNFTQLPCSFQAKYAIDFDYSRKFLTVLFRNHVVPYLQQVYTPYSSCINDKINYTPGQPAASAPTSSTLLLLLTAAGAVKLLLLKLMLLRQLGRVQVSLASIAAHNFSSVKSVVLQRPPVRTGTASPTAQHCLRIDTGGRALATSVLAEFSTSARYVTLDAFRRVKFRARANARA
jgi:hypothetical protein